MSVSGRWFFPCLVLAAVTPSLAGAGEGNADRVKRIDRSLSATAGHLLPQQAKDGAWRSEVYGAFKDGGALTPLVLHALQGTPASPKLEAAYRKGAAYLAGLVKADGEIDAGLFGLSYPVYTSAGAVIVL